MAALPQAITPDRGLTLRRNSSWAIVGHSVSALCQWGMILTLARLGSPETVGQFALALAITAPVFLFGNLSLRTVQATDTADAYLFSEYLGLRIVTTVLSLVFVALLSIVAGYTETVALVIIVVGISKGFGALNDVVFGLFQRRRRMDYVGRSMMLSSTSALCLLGAAFVVTHSVVWAAAGMAIGYAATLLGYNVHVARALLRQSGSLAGGGRASVVSMRPEWRRGRMFRMAQLALPLGIAATFASLAWAFPRYMVAHELGEGALGVFAALAYAMVAGDVVMSALAQSSLPVLSVHYSRGDRSAYWRMLIKLLALAATLGLVAVGGSLAVGEQAITFLYGPEFAGHNTVFVCLTIAAALGFIGWFLEYGLTATRSFRLQPIINGAFLLVTVAGVLIATPLFGLIGTSAALIIASVTQTALRAGGLFLVTREHDLLAR